MRNGSTAEGERIRILLCRDCRTVEELPFRKPSDPGPDYYLENLVHRHNSRFPHSERAATLLDVEKARWENKEQRQQFLKAIENKTDDLIDLETWASHNTFKEDALKCFNQHGRPQQGCVDFWDDSKRIGRPTPEGRAFAHENFKLAQNDPTLCLMCPVYTWVQTEIRAKRGMYRGSD